MSATVKCSGCNQMVSADASFCSVCGTELGTAGGRCADCGHAMQPGDQFCRGCGANLSEASSPTVEENRWKRMPGEFAMRIEIAELKGLLKKTLVVDSDTVALLFQQGEIKGLVNAGRHTLQALMERFKSVNFRESASALVIDSGDVEVPLIVGNMFTQENVEIGAELKVTVRLANAQEFNSNLFKTRKRMNVQDIGIYLADQTRTAITGIVSLRSVDELAGAGNLEIRDEIENAMRSELGEILVGAGLELVRVGSVDLSSEIADALRRDTGELELRTRRAELNRRVREVLTQDKLDEFSSEQEFEDFLKQVEHEMGMKDLIRGDEMDRLRSDFTHADNRAVILRRLELEEIEDDGRRDSARAELESDIELEGTRRQADIEGAVEVAQAGRDISDIEQGQRLSEHRADATIRISDHDQDMVEAKDSVDLLRQMKETKRQDRKETLEMDREHEKELLEARSQATTEALISIVDGANAADKIVQLEELRVKQDMTPEQLLTLVAAESPDVARALSEKYKAAGAGTEERLELALKHADELKALHTDSQDRTERFTQMVLQQMGQVATTRSQPPSQTVVTGGGKSKAQPIIVGGPAATPQSPPGPATQACPECGAPDQTAGQFCSACGARG